LQAGNSTAGDKKWLAEEAMEVGTENKRGYWKEIILGAWQSGGVPQAMRWNEESSVLKTGSS